MIFNKKNKIVAERLKEEIEFEQIKNEVEDYYDKYFIKAGRNICANVEVHIGNAQNRTQREHGPCVVKNINAGISYDYSK